MAAEITALPTPPSRSDPVNFSARADAFLGALPLFQTEANTLATEAESNALLAETKRDEASTFASNALVSANAAAASFDSFDDRYLGPKSSDPTLDNDGQTLLVGALYFDTTLNRMRVRNNANNAWLDAYYTDENLTVTNLTVSGALSLPDGAVTLGTETQGNYVAAVGAGTSGAQTGTSGLTITGTGEGASVTIAHADTSSQASVNNSGNTVVQDLTFDTYGHVTGVVSVEITSVSGNAGTSSQVFQNSAGPAGVYRFLLGQANNTNGVVYNGSGIEYETTTNTATISVTGNAGSASALATGRTFSVTGDATGTSGTFNGTANLSIPLTLASARRSVGDGQTWQNVTGSRAIATNYTNTTGRPIAVSIYAANVNIIGGIVVNGVRLNTLTPIQSGSITSSVFAVIPAGAVYSLETGSVFAWCELR